VETRARLHQIHDMPGLSPADVDQRIMDVVVALMSARPPGR
jgi:hypothetical protein